VGPIAAGILVFVSFPPKVPVAVDAPRGLLFDFRPILKNREAMRYILGYAAHCWELFGLRSWLPAFFAFSISLSGSTGGVLLGAAALAAWINLLGPASSILGNEAAIHKGRRSVIALTMTGSGIFACLVGFSAPLPLILVFIITAFYFDRQSAAQGTTPTCIALTDRR
ncbi:MAG: hypothetical protein ABR539_14040, partial [Halomonas sp.]